MTGLFRAYLAAVACVGVSLCGIGARPAVGTAAAGAAGAAGAAAAVPTATASQRQTATATTTATTTATATVVPSPTASPNPGKGGVGTGEPGSCPRGQFGIPFPINGPLCIDVFAFIDTFFIGFAQLLTDALDHFLEPVVAVLTYTPDFTDRAVWGPLAQFGENMRLLGEALFAVLVVWRLVVSAAQNLLRSPLAIAIDVLGRLVVVAAYLGLLDYLFHLYFTFLNDLVAYIDAGAVRPFARQLVRLVTQANVTNVTSQLFLFALLGLGFIGVTVIIALTRLGGLFILGGLYVVAPLCIATFMGPGVNRVGRWWLQNFVSYSAWPVAYAVLIKIIGIFLFTLPREPGFAGQVVAPLMGFAGLGALLAVPRLMRDILGGFDAGSSNTFALLGQVARRVSPF